MIRAALALVAVALASGACAAAPAMSFASASSAVAGATFVPEAEASGQTAPVWTTVAPAAVIPVPDAIGAIAVTTDGKTVWAATNGGILRIDGVTNRVVRLAAPAASDDTFLSIASDGLWVARFAGGHLYRLDPNTGAVRLSIELPAAVDPQFVGDELWVGREDMGEMVQIDRKTGAIGRSVSTGAYGTAGLGDLWFALDGSPSPTIERVDPASGSVIATIQVKGEENCGVGGTFPDNVWMSCSSAEVIARTVSRIDPATNSVVAAVALPPSHGAAAVVVDGSVWLLGSFADATGASFGGLLRVDPATGAIERFVSIGPADPDNPVVAAGALWIPDEAGHRILRVNIADIGG